MNYSKIESALRLAIGLTFLLLPWRTALCAREVVLFDNLGNADVIGEGPWNSSTDKFLCQQFFTGNTNTLLHVTVQLKRVGSPNDGPLHIDLWDDNGSGFPDKRIARLGTFNIASLSSSWREITLDTRIEGLLANSAYYILFDFFDTGVTRRSHSVEVAFTRSAQGSNGANVVLTSANNNATHENITWAPLTNFISFEANYVRLKIVAEDPGVSSEPLPADHDTDVSRDAVLTWKPAETTALVDGHIVYFGDSFIDVNDGTGGVPQSETSYDPGRLDFDTTYHWRVDQVTGQPDLEVFKGNIWSFTTEPFGYPIVDVVATGSGSLNPETTPEKTINGSGLADDRHGTQINDMWVSDAVPAWIQYEFYRAYKLHTLEVWNGNQTVEPLVGFGAKDVLIEHSSDGVAWTTQSGVSAFSQGFGEEEYAANTVIDFGGVMAQVVRLSINSTHGNTQQASLSEVRFSYIPVRARAPQPEDEATEASLDTILTWRPGREAGSHRVFLSEHLDAVSSEGSLIATTSEASLDLSQENLTYGETYYWKVNEVNELESPTIHIGDLWSFSAPEFLVIDDMERYRDQEGLEIWQHWVDGVGDDNNGSLVGNENEAEEDQVIEGRQSLPLLYDHGPGMVSAATHTFDPPLDWVRGDPQVLSLFFLGDPSVFRSNLLNDPAPLYVEITDSSGMSIQIDYPDPAATHITSWTEWVIPISDLVGLDLSSVQSMTIGIGSTGQAAKGKMFFDNIRVGTPRSGTQE